ncbi:hypothetical protein G7Y89_g14682 [Cudoniella acicularis]|uniref:Uncharacterized protein n=1 Tax=Cudoniella acicularis TaxID=354080 RepID=A0A8H4R0G2_9HELO|nr:hypothetical protein G7Y89_g14682 [Cudoniella acicularis]
MQTTSNTTTTSEKSRIDTPEHPSNFTMAVQIDLKKVKQQRRRDEPTSSISMQHDHSEPTAAPAKKPDLANSTTQPSATPTWTHVPQQDRVIWEPVWNSMENTIAADKKMKETAAPETEKAAYVRKVAFAKKVDEAIEVVGTLFVELKLPGEKDNNLSSEFDEEVEFYEAGSTNNYEDEAKVDEGINKPAPENPFESRKDYLGSNIQYPPPRPYFQPSAFQVHSSRDQQRNKNYSRKDEHLRREALKCLIYLEKANAEQRQIEGYTEEPMVIDAGPEPPKLILAHDQIWPDDYFENEYEGNQALTVDDLPRAEETTNDGKLRKSLDTQALHLKKYRYERERRQKLLVRMHRKRQRPEDMVKPQAYKNPQQRTYMEERMKEKKQNYFQAWPIQTNDLPYVLEKQMEHWAKACQDFFGKKPGAKFPDLPRQFSMPQSRLGGLLRLDRCVQDGRCVKGEKLRICYHKLELPFRKTAKGEYGEEWLKKERLRWHPDKFPAGEWLEGTQEKAQEMFQLIQALIIDMNPPVVATSD